MFSNILLLLVPKSIPGGRAPELNPDEVGREHPYLRSFENLSRSWSFVNPSLCALLEQSFDYFQNKISPPPVTPKASPLPLPPPPVQSLPNPGSVLPGSLPSPLIGSKRELSMDDPNRPVWGARGTSGGTQRGNRLNSGRK